MNIFNPLRNQQMPLWKKIAKSIPGATRLKQYGENFHFQPRRSKRPDISPYMKRPFAVDDLTVVPKDWRIGDGPDFVGISAGKSGTTWWYSMLMKHPQIVQNRLNKKELSYFSHFKYHGLNDEQILTYRQAFAAPKSSICGEWSPGYLSLPFCTEYLKLIAPNTKILILLRNPIDRVLSAINHKSQVRVKYYNFNVEQQYVHETFELYPSAVKGGLHSIAISHLLRHFERDQIFVLQYEKCKMNPLEEIARTYRFLGVDDQFKPQNVDRKINQKTYFLSSFTSEERHRMAAYFTFDVRRISEIFPEIDLSLWPDFID